jgi:short-subunit dehydrogenase
MVQPLTATLITGATSGIGRELANLAAADGCNLVLIARDKKRLSVVAAELTAIYNTKVYALDLDLSQRDFPKKVMAFLKQSHLEIDTLINNAGFGWRGEFTNSDQFEMESMIDLNVTALTSLTRVLLPQLLKSKQGKILNVASIAAFFPGPYMAVYYASKAYVLSFSLGLREELAGTKVSVTALCPGPTRTGFAGRAGLKYSELFRTAVSVESVALAGYSGMKQGKAIVVPGWSHRLMTVLSGLLPSTLQARWVARLQDT